MTQAPDNPIEELKSLIRTRHSIVTVRTVEEDFAVRSIREAAREMRLKCFEWSLSDGMRLADRQGRGIVGTETLEGALRLVRHSEPDTIYVLKDATRLLADAKAERMLRDAAAEFHRDRRTLFMIDAAGQLPASLRPMAVPFEIALPDRVEILQILRDIVEAARPEQAPAAVRMSRDDLDAFVRNLSGLTRREVAQVAAEAVFSDSVLSGEDLERAILAKRRRLEETSVLDFIPSPKTPPRVGGMEHLREWLARRREALTTKAREFGLEPPRGILMLGVQGCGKSLMARYVAADWKMPLLRMDVGALYDKYVGETERHLRQAFAVAAATAPCVVWIDEIEKAFASAAAGAGAAVSDGGLSQRLFGQLLTWMQDHAEPIFVVATANDVQALPPELLRKGRFDEVFFVDLPGRQVRKEIFAIHLQRRKRKPADFDLEAAADASAGFSGAEIEQVVVSALYAAFGLQRELTSADLLAEIQVTRPLSVLMAEKVAELRAWAQGRCVPAD